MIDYNGETHQQTPKYASWWWTNSVIKLLNSMKIDPTESTNKTETLYWNLDTLKMETKL